MRSTMFCTLMLIGGLAGAATPAPQTRVYEAVTGHAPDAVSRLRVTQVGDNAYAIDFFIVAPNPSQHTGRVRGLATREGNRLVLNVPNFMEDGNLDDPPLCTMVFESDAARARVVSEQGCTGFHGAGANFLDQGKALVRVPSAGRRY